MSGSLPRQKVFPALTGIRAIAAWMVFVHHFNFFKPAFFGQPIYLFFSEFHVGVPIFFVLSGLLITLRYYDRSINHSRSFYNYMVKRFARIYPAFFLILILNFVWLLFTRVYSPNRHAFMDFTTSVTLLRGFFAGFAPQLVPQSWSLTAEECFYLSCPLFFVLIKKQRSNLVLIPLALICVGLLLTCFFRQHPFHGLFADIRFLFNFTFFGRCAEFFAGVATALLYLHRKPQTLPGFRFTIFGALMIVLSIIGLAMLHDGNYYGDHHPLGICINNLLLPVFGIAPLFWGLLTEKNFLSSLLGSAPMVLFGKSSYVFYLVHLGLFATVFFTGVTHNPIAMFVWLNAVAVTLYLLFEHPVNLFLRRRLLRPEPAAVEESF